MYRYIPVDCAQCTRPVLRALFSLGLRSNLFAPPVMVIINLGDSSLQYSFITLHIPDIQSLHRYSSTFKYYKIKKLIHYIIFYLFGHSEVVIIIYYTLFELQNCLHILQDLNTCLLKTTSFLVVNTSIMILANCNIDLQEHGCPTSFHIH